MTFYLAESPHWSGFCRLLAEKKITPPNTDYSGLANDPQSFEIISFCNYVFNSHLNSEEKKNVFRLLLPSLFILLNPSYIQQVIQNPSDSALVLNGIHDVHDKLIRTEHSFSFQREQYHYLQQRVRNLNEYLEEARKHNYYQSVIEHFKQIVQGDWQSLLEQLPPLPLVDQDLGDAAWPGDDDSDIHIFPDTIQQQPDGGFSLGFYNDPRNFFEQFRDLRPPLHPSIVPTSGTRVRYIATLTAQAKQQMAADSALFEAWCVGNLDEPRPEWPQPEYYYTSRKTWNDSYLEEKEVNFRDFCTRFHLYHFNNRSLSPPTQSDLSQIPAFKRFINRVCAAKDQINQRYRKVHGQYIQVERWIEQTLKTLSFMLNNSDLLASFVEQGSVPTYYYRNQRDRRNNALRSDAEMSFHLGGYSTGQQFKQFIQDACAQLAGLFDQLDDQGLIELAISFQPIGDDKGCLDHVLTPVLDKAMLLLDKKLDLDQLISTIANQAQGIYFLPRMLEIARAHCIQHQLFNQTVVSKLPAYDQQILSPELIAHYFKTILNYEEKPAYLTTFLDVWKARLQPTQPQQGALAAANAYAWAQQERVNDLLLPISPSNPRQVPLNQATLQEFLNLRPTPPSLGWAKLLPLLKGTSPAEQLLQETCNNLMNEKNRLDDFARLDDHAAQLKLAILKTFETQVFSQFHTKTMNANKAKQLIGIMVETWSQQNKQQAARRTLHQDRDHLSYLRALGPLTLYLLPLVAFLSGFFFNRFDTQEGRAWGAVFAPRGIGFFGSQTRSERHMLHTIQTLEAFSNKHP